MAVLIIGEAEGLTAEIYLGMFRSLEQALNDAPGFIMHAGHALEGNVFRVLEIWRSKEESDRFFAINVAPNLPPHVRPKRRTVHLSALSFGDAAVETYAAANVITRRGNAVSVV
jgi:hypothetical protein